MQDSRHRGRARTSVDLQLTEQEQRHMKDPGRTGQMETEDSWRHTQVRLEEQRRPSHQKEGDHVVGLHA